MNALEESRKARAGAPVRKLRGETCYAYITFVRMSCLSTFFVFPPVAPRVVHPPASDRVKHNRWGQVEARAFWIPLYFR